MKTGITSSRKLIGGLDRRLRDLDRDRRPIWPPKATARVVSPSAAG